MGWQILGLKRLLEEVMFFECDFLRAGGQMRVQTGGKERFVGLEKGNEGGIERSL